MILTIKISDDLYEQYGKLNTQNPRYAIEKTLEKFAEAGYSAKTLVVAKDALKELQDILGVLETPEDLVAAVKRLASIDIGGFEIPLSESQRKAIETQAKFFNQNQKDFAATQIKRGLVSTLGV